MDLLSSQKSINTTSKLQLLSSFSDVLIKLDDGTHFESHKFLLAKHSQFFLKLFTYENVHEYHLGNVSCESFANILDWIYKHKIPSDFEVLLNLLIESDYLCCQEIVEIAIRSLKLKINSENVLGTLMFCRQYNFTELEKWSWNYTEYNFSSVCLEEEFLFLPVEDLACLLLSDKLNVTEIRAFEAMYRWVHNPLEERERHVSRLFGLLRHTQLWKDLILRCPRIFQELETNEAQMKDLPLKPDAMWLMAKQCFPDLPELPFDTAANQQPRLWYNTLLSAGGWSLGGPCNLFESFDMRANTWTQLQLKDPLGERCYANMAVIGNIVYMAGGFRGNDQAREVSCLNIVTREFKILSSMIEKRCFLTMVALGDGSLLAAGGCNGGHRSKTAERYTVETNQWDYIQPMHQVRSDAGSAVLNENVYVAGGFNGEQILDSVECYNTETNDWSYLPSMSSKRSGCQLLAVNGQLYALGGFNGQERLAKCEAFCLLERKWSSIPDMKLGRSNFGAAVADGKIIVAGGFSETSPVREVECFDLKSQSWSQLCDMNLPKSALSFVCLPGININHPDVRAPQLEDLPDGVVVGNSTEHSSSLESIFENLNSTLE